MPDAEPAWRLWRSLAATKTETLDSPAEIREGSKPVVVGLPATACRTVGMVLPAADHTLLPAMIEAQLEKRGVNVLTEPAPNFAWHLLGQDGAHSIVSVDVLAQPFPETLAVNHAANYTAALRMMSLPPREIVVVEEHGLLVLAAGLQGRLWHSHIIGSSEIAVEDLARELDMAKLSLESNEGFGTIRGVTLVGDRLAAMAADLKKRTSMPVERVAALEPNRGLKLDSFQKLLPASVFEVQTSKARLRKILRLAVLGAILYVAIISLCTIYLNKLQREVKVIEDQVAETAEPAAAVRDTAQFWQSLEPAIEPQRYPMVQLSEVTALLPPSGIVIKRFDAKLNEIDIIGDARDAQTFTTLKDELNAHPKLGQFTWTGPVPSVRDKVASFKLQGKLESR